MLAHDFPFSGSGTASSEDISFLEEWRCTAPVLDTSTTAIVTVAVTRVCGLDEGTATAVAVPKFAWSSARHEGFNPICIVAIPGGHVLRGGCSTAQRCESSLQDAPFPFLIHFSFWLRLQLHLWVLFSASSSLITRVGSSARRTGKAHPSQNMSQTRIPFSVINASAGFPPAIPTGRLARIYECNAPVCQAHGPWSSLYWRGCRSQGASDLPPPVRGTTLGECSAARPSQCPYGQSQ